MNVYSIQEEDIKRNNEFFMHRTDKKESFSNSDRGGSFPEIFDELHFALILLDIDSSIKWYNKKANHIFVKICGIETFSSILFINFLFGTIQEYHRTIKELLKGKPIEQEKEYKTWDNEIIWLEIRICRTEHSGNILVSFQDITKRKNFIMSVQHYDSILSAVSFASEKFLNSVDLGKSINDVLEKLGEATEVNRIQILSCIEIEGQHREFDTLFEWSDGIARQTDSNFILRNLSYSALGLEEWEKLLAKGAIVSGNITDFNENEKKFLQLHSIKSILIIPVFAGKKFWGIIKFDNLLNERKLTATEIDALYASGQILGAAIQRIDFEKQLIIARDAAEKSSRLKTEFLAQMSHEIRTPINSILCFSSLLKSEVIDRIPAELKSCFDAIDNGGRRLIRTIDMILNMSQFQSGCYEANYQTVDLTEEFFEDIINEFRPIARAKGLEIIFIKNSNDTRIKADIYTLEQIFINLIDNAIKFTLNGEIKIIVYHGIDMEICVDINDTGVGISREYLPNLFTPFTQEEMGYTRKFEGNGLGLALVQKYLEINKADILVNSDKNTGSTFTILFRDQLC